MLLRHNAVVHLQTGDIAKFDDDVQAFSQPLQPEAG